MTAAKRRSAPPISDEEARIQAGIASDPENPELTDEQLAALRPASEVLPPALYAALAARSGRAPAGGQPTQERPTVQMILPVDANAAAAWRASGEGWESRINDLLVREAPQVKRGAR